MWDVTTDSKISETNPIAGKKLISTLVTASDGNIWGIADEYLFVLSPVDSSVIHSQRLLANDIVYTAEAWHRATLVDGEDGYVYGVNYGHFFKVNVSTKTVTEMEPADCGKRLTRDANGDLYFFDESGELFRYQQ